MFNIQFTQGFRELLGLFIRNPDIVTVATIEEIGIPDK